MPNFSQQSEDRLAQLDSRLVEILREAIKLTDFTVLCTLRNEADQTTAFNTGHSKTQYPKSKHNRCKRPDGSYDMAKAAAVDIAPYPVVWPDAKNQSTVAYRKSVGRFYRLAGVIETIAARLGHKIKWGGDWDSIFDAPHFELIDG